jgi:hypothetical protein
MNKRKLDHSDCLRSLTIEIDCAGEGREVDSIFKQGSDAKQTGRDTATTVRHGAQEERIHEGWGCDSRDEFFVCRWIRFVGSVFSGENPIFCAAPNDLGTHKAQSS